MPNLLDFMAAVRFQESTDNYTAQNGSYYGAYQFGQGAFKETGYMNSDGTWTGKNGINSYADWTDTNNIEIENIQDEAFLEWVYIQWRYIRGEDMESLTGQTLNGVDLTISGMIAGSHLVGTTRFRNDYVDSGGVDVPADDNGTSVVDYIEQFDGYDLSDLTGVNADIIPNIAGGFANYFVDNHDLGNTFNRHSDDNIDLIGNSNTNDYPIHGGTGDDRFFGFGPAPL